MIDRIALVMFLPFVLMAGTPVAEERDNEDAANIRFGQRPSDIPTMGLVHNLSTETSLPNTSLDVSAHPDKRIYVGYGIYDPDQEHCALADVGALDGTDPVESGRFDENSLQIHNGHSYLMSVNSMDYASCREIAANYYGYPVIVTNEGENEFLTESYEAEPHWLGIFKLGLNEPYKDQLGRNVSYFNFSREDESWAATLSHVLKAGDYWFKTSENESRKCVVEFESEDYKRPVKVCAPWWSIERRYRRPPESRYMVESVDENGDPTMVDIRTFNQADYPIRLKVCTERQPLPPNADPDATITVTCNSYYDVTRSPQCQQNPEQDLCFVNECRGSIINACTLIDTEDAPKGYGKMMVIDENGQETYIRGQVDVKMHKYECSAYTTSSPCLTYSDVTMLPQPCPNDTIDPNDPESRPIRVYGSAQRAQYDNNGSLTGLQGKCPSGDLVDVPIDVLVRNTRVCKEYDWIENERLWSERCLTERAYSDVTVSTSLTEHDAYEDDPMCVRLNNIVDAQPDRETVIRYMQKGYADMILKKAYIEGTETPDWSTPIGTGYIEHVLSNMDWVGEDDNGTLGNANQMDLSPEQLAELADLDINCSALSEGHEILLEGNIRQYQWGMAMQEIGLGDSLDLVDTFTPAAGPRLHVAYNVTWSQCEDLNTRINDYVWTEAGGHLPVVWSEIVVTKEFFTPLSRNWVAYTRPEISALQTDLNARYRFDDAGISVSNLITPESEVWEVGECPLLVQGYWLAQLGDTSATDTTFRTETRLEVDFDSCLELAYCSAGNILNSMRYEGVQRCRLSYDGDSNAEEFVSERIDAKLEEFADAAQPPVESPSMVRSHDEDNSWQSIPENPLAIDGTNEIFFLQEFSPGLRGWGYLPSYNFLSYTSSIVSANGHQIWPVQQLPNMTEPLDFEWRNWRKTRTFRGTNSPFVNANAYVGESGGFQQRPESYAYTFMSGGTGFLLSSIVTIFSGVKKEFEADVSVKIYSDQSDYRRYIPNFYPDYEGRVEEGARFRYSQLEYATRSPLRESDAARFYDSVGEIIDDFAETLNIYSPSEPPIRNLSELRNLMGVTIGWRGLDWWNPWDVKTRTSGSSVTSGVVEMKRNVTTHYMGAVNGVGIVVPYAGDYEVRAYDSHGLEISYVDVPESTFVSITGFGPERAAQAWLGRGMNTVVTGPCQESSVAVVGGGTVGGYVELKSSDPRFADCSEADHVYVEEHAIKQLQIKVKNTDKYYVVDLDYPMPWVNRTFLITYNYKQDKIYRCFGDFRGCDEFLEVDNE